MVGNDNCGLTVEFIYIIKVAQVQSAADGFQQFGIAVGVFGLVPAEGRTPPRAPAGQE